MYGNKKALDGGPSLSSMYAEAYQGDPLVQRGVARKKRTPPARHASAAAVPQSMSSMYAEAYQGDPLVQRGLQRRARPPASRGGGGASHLQWTGR